MFNSNVLHRSIEALLICLALSTGASAAVTEYIVQSQWLAAVPAYTFVDFTGHPFGSILGDQYASAGLLFTDGNDQIDSTPSYITDNWGITGHPSFDGDTIGMAFTTPQYWIAADFPGLLQYELYYGGQLIYSSTDWVWGGGLGNFSGLISTEPFDAVKLRNPITNHVFVDNLYFGGPIPGPTGLALLVVGVVGGRRKRSA